MRVISLTASVILLLSGAANLAAIASGSARDGAWWSTVDQYRHLGFLEGYIDCDAYINPTSNRFVGVSAYDLEDMITRYYADRPKDVTKPVEVVLLTIAPLKKNPNGKSTFGVFDGESWRQGGKPYRVGFVEGYFGCLQSSPSPVAHFSRPDSYYVEQISKWYGVKDDDPSAIDMKKDSEMIAHVLFMFKDSPSGQTDH